jgi:hypothetical protein
MAKYGLGKSSPIEDVFTDAGSDVSSFTSLEEREKETFSITGSSSRNNLSTDSSQVDIAQVRGVVYEAEKNILGIINEIDLNLKKVNIDPYANMNIEKAHSAVWKDALKHNAEAKKYSMPEVVCYEEYLFAEKHRCRSCRAFVKEYELTISQSTFGHLLDVRKVIKNLLNELLIIKNIVTYYLGESYRDDTEAQIAKYLTDWTKAASHYTKQLAKEITTTPISIPQTELDQISKKQAAQFQSFFSIKINSYTTEIHTLSNLIKRESVDTAEAFYKNYLLPALSMKSKVIEPMMLDLETSNLGKRIPTLFKEMFVANSAVVGNLGAITADLLERNNLMYRRFDALLQAIKLKRRYINYLVQLESLGLKRKNVLLTQVSDSVNIYKDIYDNIPVDISERENLRSSHNDLDDVDGDAHPQYLRRDGGIITGDILIQEGVKIAGIDLANHTHNFEDGSIPISAASIDYQSAREQYYESSQEFTYGKLRLTDLNSKVLVGGVPQYEAVFEIEIDDDLADTYEFEILYKEL